MNLSPPKPRYVCLFSGGLDSTVLLYHLRQTFDVTALFIDLGKSCDRSFRSAVDIAHIADVHLEVIDLSHQEALFEPMENPVPGWVPGRNLLMLSWAMVFAMRKQIPGIAWGAVASDVFPDNSKLFLEAAQVIGTRTGFKPIDIEAPFIDYTKREIVELGKRLNAPMEFSWSCWNQTREPCRVCKPCKERSEAMREVGYVSTH